MDWLITDEEIPAVTQLETQAAMVNFSPTKAPGWDGIRGDTMKLLHETAPRFCNKLFNELLKAGIFPPEWKRGKMVLIPKPGASSLTAKD